MPVGKEAAGRVGDQRHGDDAQEQLNYARKTDRTDSQNATKEIDVKR